MANREEETRGAFFESRFKSVAILDEESLLATCAYISRAVRFRIESDRASTTPQLICIALFLPMLHAIVNDFEESEPASLLAPTGGKAEPAAV